MSSEEILVRNPENKQTYYFYCSKCDRVLYSRFYWLRGSRKTNSCLKCGKCLYLQEEKERKKRRYNQRYKQPRELNLKFICSSCGKLSKRRSWRQKYCLNCMSLDVKIRMGLIKRPLRICWNCNKEFKGLGRTKFCNKCLSRLSKYARDKISKAKRGFA